MLIQRRKTGIYGHGKSSNRGSDLLKIWINVCMRDSSTSSLIKGNQRSLSINKRIINRWKNITGPSLITNKSMRSNRGGRSSDKICSNRFTIGSSFKHHSVPKKSTKKNTKANYKYNSTKIWIRTWIVNKNLWASEVWNQLQKYIYNNRLMNINLQIKT